MALGRVNVGGGKKSIGNAVESNVLLGKTFSNATGNDKVGTMPNNGAVSHSLAINGSYTIPEGYHSGTGKVSQTVTTKGAQTYTPSTTNQTVPSGRYLTGTQTILGDANLLAGNIKNGVSIFGVIGSATIPGGTAGAAQILAGYTFINSAGVEVTGTIPSKGAETFTPSTTAQTITAGQYLTGNQIILGDVNLVSANIKSGATIFGVAGNSNVVDTSAGDAVASQVLYGKKAYVDGALVTGSMPNNGAVTNSLAINGSYTIPAGYHSGTGKVTQSITTKAAATYTPSTTAQTISAGQYLSGAQTISAVAGLSAGNIKSGVNVGGVVGTFTSDATIPSSNYLYSGVTAYKNGEKITGTMAVNGSQAATLTTQGAIKDIPLGYTDGGRITVNISNLSAGNVKSGVNVGGVVGTLASPAKVLDIKTYAANESGSSSHELVQKQIEGYPNAIVNVTVVVGSSKYVNIFKSLNGGPFTQLVTTTLPSSVTISVSTSDMNDRYTARITVYVSKYACTVYVIGHRY